MDEYILVLYYSRGGKTAAMAEVLAEGISTQQQIDFRIRTVPAIAAPADTADADYPLCDIDDLVHCAGLAMGSPTRFGTMASPLKHFLEQTSPQWLNGDLAGKPACVFTSTSTLHGGQEATLLSMMLPLLHHGMLLMGTPYTNADLHTTESGGTPYGPSHWDKDRRALSAEEKRLLRAQGKRLAQVASRLLVEK